jgi:CRISPR system Cascade subunit CasD
MSFENMALALRLEGPLQSWGVDSQFSRRNTGLLPTKSGIAGMCCAAFGHPRGSLAEKEFLKVFASLRMTAVVIPRMNASGKSLPVRRLSDYHTVQNTRRASGAINTDCVLTHRQYLCDALFGVVLEGRDEMLRSIADALADPVWGLWLGRKACIPSAPVLAGLKENREEAFRLLLGDLPLEAFIRQEEAASFGEGLDSLPDLAISFASERRLFSPRRVITRQPQQT